MATVLFVVKATIPRKKEAAFNRWYNYKHCPQFLRARFAYTQVWP